MTTTTTTNYGWVIPNDSELVTNGAAAIRTLGSSADASLKTVSDAAVAKSIVDAKGDLIAGTADNTIARVAVGTDGQVLTADAASTAGVKWSTPTSNGVTAWNLRKNPVNTSSSMNAIGYNGSNLYVAGDNAGAIYTSPDGKTWTSRTSAMGGNAVYTIAYGNGLWVAAGNNGTLTTSPDGITWTARTSQFSTGPIYAALYANSLWLIVGSNAGGTAALISSSTDGITWTARTPATSGPANAIAYGGGYWVISTDLSTNNYMYSTNGTTWTGAANGAQSMQYIFYANSIWYHGNNTSTAYPVYTNASTPNTAWIGTANNINFYGATFNNGYLYNNQYYYAQIGTTTSPGYLYTFLGNISNTAGTVYLNGFGLPILTPLNRNQNTIISMVVTSSGYILGDNVGRIYTSY